MYCSGWCGVVKGVWGESESESECGGGGGGEGESEGECEGESEGESEGDCGGVSEGESEGNCEGEPHMSLTLPLNIMNNLLYTLSSTDLSNSHTIGFTAYEQ